MIDRKQETVQALVDQASRGALDRRTLLSLASALGVASLVGPSLIDGALAAGANQAGNRELKAAYDYVVVGAGAAGCIIASRLAQAGASDLHPNHVQFEARSWIAWQGDGRVPSGATNESPELRLLAAV